MQYQGQWNKTIAGDLCFYFEIAAERCLILFYFWEIEPNYSFPIFISIFISPAWVTAIFNSDRLNYKPGS